MKHLTIALFLPFCVPAFAADPQFVDLTQPNVAVPFTVNYASKKTMTQKYMSIQAVTAALPCFVGYCRSISTGKLAMTDAEIMAQYEVTAAALQAIWYTSSASEAPWCGTGTGDYAVNNSRAVIKFPSGAFYTKIPIMSARGELWGMGSDGWTDGQYSTGGTTILIDQGGWINRVFPEKMLIQSENWMRGNEYVSGCKVHGFRLDGTATYSPATNYTSYGIALLDAGEASHVYDIFATGFKTGGFLFWKGTPANISECSAFMNHKYGFAFLGASTTQLFATDLSGDDNGEWLVYLGPDKNGAIGGGTFTCNGLKYEVGTRETWQRQGVLKAVGAFNITLMGVSCQVFGAATAIPNAFQVDSRDPSGWPMGASLTVSEFRLCGSDGKFTKLLTDHAGYWNPPAYCQPINFSWNNLSRMKCTSVTLSGTGNQPSSQCVPVVVVDRDSTGTPCPPPVVCPPCPTVCAAPNVCIPPCPPPIVCPPPVVCPPCPVCPPSIGPTWSCGNWSGYNWFGNSTRTCTCTANCGGITKKVETRRR